MALAFEGPCLCGSRNLSRVHLYMEPPQGEIGFAFSRNAAEYRRELWRCDRCGHLLSIHALDTGALYEGDYVSANYQDLEGLRKTFNRITNLPPESSDNVGRVRRVLEFASTFFPANRFEKRVPEILDVGSGLCVFLHEIKKRSDWKGTALDPDARSAQHARETVQVAAIQGDFLTREDLGQFDVITFNRVLEHVKDPVTMLSRAQRFLKEGGFVYLELPDGEEALRESPLREEFTIDHFHAFSMASIVLLGQRAGFTVLTAERMREPSRKYTVRAFLRKSQG